ncbi:hypothetical protein PI124_g22123 [Phytophthora idaei]|nr:hypothetical protein PI124_g22123 [Phytophthora idaei]
MPRESKRLRLLRDLSVLLDRRLQVRKARLALGVKGECDDELDDFLLARVQAVARYLSPRVYLKRVPRFSWFMTECSDREFLRSFRMERDSFAKLVNLIKESLAFAITLGKRRIAACQLLVFLKFIGTHGSDACVENLSGIFNVGRALTTSSALRVRCWSSTTTSSAGRGDLVRIIRLFSSSLVIHNLLIHDPIPAELDEDITAEVEKERSLNDGATSGEDSTWEGSPGRRDQLFHFHVENDGRF